MKHAALNPSRDPRVEDPSNLWLIDPLARLLVPVAVRLRIPANAISVAGLLIGAAAAAAYERWQQPGWATLGLLISIAWLVTDSLDGMVARATNTCSEFGRELDGLCDHGVFALIYFALARSVGGIDAWGLMIAAASAHALQANLYEAERGRFHRRLNGSSAGAPEVCTSKNPAIRLYHQVASCLDWAADPFDRYLAMTPARGAVRRSYRTAAIPVLRAMVPLSQNMRLIAIFVFCFWGRVTAFLWYELVPLSILTAVGVIWHRRVEANLLAAGQTPNDIAPRRR